MKIKIVVRPEDAQEVDAAAEDARRLQLRRARWGLAALLGLIALSAATAFFFIGRGTSPAPEEQPVASAQPVPEAERPRPSTRDGTAPAAEVAGDTPAPAAQPGGGETEGQAVSDEAQPALAEEAQALPPEPATPTGSSAPGPSGTGQTAAVSIPVAPPTSSRSSGAAPGEAAKAPVVAKVPAKPDSGVVRAQLALRVIDREPGEPLQSPVNLGAGARTVYYFTEFRNLRGQTVTHRWEYDGRVMASIPFRVEGNRWRVYSSKRIGDNQRGPWRVTAVDKAGAVLARAEFSAE